MPTESIARDTERCRQRGFSLVEVMVVAAIIAAMLAIAVPSTQRYLSNQTANDMARTISSAFDIARTEAMRTGRIHVVFFAVGGAGDAAGNALADQNGNPAAVLILDDGPSGSPNQNCAVDPGENIQTVSPVAGLNWGYTNAGPTKAPGDSSPRPSASGSSFATSGGGGATWVLFRPDGTPASADALCNPGAIGSGNGGIYFTNGTRDQAVVLGPLGVSRVHIWNTGAGAWTP